MSDEKKLVRKNAKMHRDQLRIDPHWPEQAADIFFDRIKIETHAIVSAYYPIGKEMDPSAIVEGLWQQNITVCLPVVQGDMMPLKFAEWTGKTGLAASSLGVLEPVGQDWLDPDILIVPLLAFDQRGYRLGYGKGHYDATLRELRSKKEVLAVGLAYAEQAVLLALPMEEHDQQLDVVVTPQRFFDFRR